jgi:hypothetical protein
MRTKTLLLTAALSVAGMVSAMAAVSSNVYSVNVVGYVTKTIQPGFNLICNPLVQTNTHLTELIPAPPDLTVAYILTPGGYNIYTFYVDLPGWDPDPSAQLLDPGAGLFILNPLSTTFQITFVGEVAQGLLSNSIPANFSMQSSKVPQKTNTLALGLAPAHQDVIYQFFNNGTSTGYNIYTYYSDLPGWDPEPPAPDNASTGPTMDVGDAWLYFSAGASSMVRNFTVE